ncbi:hypothetical protein N6H14_14865 [Paenibacillus sp. CC-CFT747]|nr:hypothetical protein N6H14_14865 [Paenibacillus sp. CC-CFT747]
MKESKHRIEKLSEAQKIIPTDAVKIKEYKEDEGRYVVQYESKLLAVRLKDYYESAKDLGLTQTFQGHLM